jgi:lysophospholipase L1-like esterase
MARLRWFRRDLARPVLATAIGVLAALLILEAGMRVVVAKDPLPAAQLRKSAQLEPPAFDDCHVPNVSAGLGHIVRPSTVDGLVYELKPSVDTCYQGARHRTNADGQRARSLAPFPRPKPPGVFRVLLLGDSYAYAQGVEYESSLAAELERRLSSKASGITVEVVNTGVPGYNTAQEAAYFAAHGMSYQPDCVVILFVANDLGVPYLMLEPRDPLSFKRSYVLEALLSLSDREDGSSPEIPPGMFRGTDRQVAFVNRRDFDRIPEQYRYMVGAEGYRHALGSIAEAAHGIPVVNVADYTDASSLDEADRFALVAFQRELGIHHVFVPTLRDPTLWVGPKDMHPNARGHAFIADQVLKFLEERKLCLPGSPKP